MMSNRGSGHPLQAPAQRTGFCHRPEAFRLCPAARQQHHFGEQPGCNNIFSKKLKRCAGIHKSAYSISVIFKQPYCNI
jgi:hypothetical protein